MTKNKVFDEIILKIKENKNICIISHIHPDGDAIGSELAFYHFLKKYKKNVIILNHDKLPENYNFLPGSEACKKMKDTDRKIIEQVDLFILLDCSNLDRIGETTLFLKSCDIINIDHHCSNDSYGTINYIDPTASSTGEIIFNFINYANPEMMTKDIAECLFTAIITDTGAFRYENTSEKTFEVTSRLISTGIKSHIISQNIYNRKSFKELKLLGFALSTLETDKNNMVSWVTIQQDMLKKTNTSEENTEGIIEMVTTIKNCEIFLLFRETLNDSVKVSLRSKGHFNVNLFALKYGGGGHPNAAGCIIKGKLPDVKNSLIPDLLNEISVKD